MGPSLEAKNALVAKLSEAFFSLMVDFWLSFQLSRKLKLQQSHLNNTDNTAPVAYDASTTATLLTHRQNASFIPCDQTAELLLILVQHVAVIGLLEKIQPSTQQNTFLSIVQQQKIYAILRKPLFDFFLIVFSSMPYQYDLPLFSQVNFSCFYFCYSYYFW